MMCGSSSGVLLPPFTVYKAEKIWQQWTELGPKGVHHNRTHRRSIDAQTFTDWFEIRFLPHKKHLPGHKVLLGDNPPYNFTNGVLKQCQQDGIAFIFLLFP
nr:unnamed protein product [Callosobruchus analis]